MNNARKDWVDYAKGIGIILVVYGHLLSSGYHGGLAIPKHFFELSDSIVYSFHMPLFFLLSGLFVESSLQKRGAWEYLKDKLLRIAYPYFIWSILQMSVEVLFSSQTQRGASISDILAIVYRPWGQFWFIYVLFLMHVVYTLVSMTGRFTPVLIFIIGVWLFFNPISLNVSALGSFSIHFIFFLCGIYLRRYLVDIEALSLPLWATLSLLVTLLGSGYFVFQNAIEPMRLANGLHPYYLLYFSILGIIACISLSQYLAKKKSLQLLRILGVYSLQIYLVHMLAGAGTRLVLQQVFQLQNWVLHILLGVAAALLIPIAIQKISERINFPYLFELKIKK